ncbi:MAG: SCP2 sterol-binding domain-containing protein [Sphingobacteriaceae bacterium]|nr:SCP2 sterol-binding domain-containing protein [Cytophagaceae bacterium]
MTLQDLTGRIADLAAQKGGMGNSIKFETDEGIIHIDANGAVSNTDQGADCTIKMDVDDLNKLMNGDLNPMMAFMLGKLKISGDMSVAMKLQTLF